MSEGTWYKARGEMYGENVLGAGVSRHPPPPPNPMPGHGLGERRDLPKKPSSQEGKKKKKKAADGERHKPPCRNFKQISRWTESSSGEQ